MSLSKVCTLIVSLSAVVWAGVASLKVQIKEYEASGISIRRHGSC